jgi:hypothetical protein
MNRQQRQQLIKDLSSTPNISAANQKKLDALIILEDADQIKKRGVVDYRKAEPGSVTEYGVIVTCKLCGKNGASRRPRWGNGLTMIVHSIKPTEPGGRARLGSDFHMLSADGSPVRRQNNRHTRQKED